MDQQVISKIQISLMAVMKLLKLSQKKIKKKLNLLCCGRRRYNSSINKIKLIDSFNFVSTAGGAFLEYLEGKELPWYKSFELICQN